MDCEVEDRLASLLHVQCYHVYPALVVVPSLVVGVVADFVLRAVESQRVVEQRVLLNAQQTTTTTTTAQRRESTAAVVALPLREELQQQQQQHRGRRQSLQAGVELLRGAQHLCLLSPCHYFVVCVLECVCLWVCA